VGRGHLPVLADSDTLRAVDRYEDALNRMKIVKRFIIPLMADDHIPGQRRRFGLNQHDLGLVMEGRACSECLAAWEEVVLLTCPVCQHTRSPQDFLDGVQEWEDYLRDREQQLANPVRTEMPQMHEVVEAIARDHGVKPR